MSLKIRTALNGLQLTPQIILKFIKIIEETDDEYKFGDVIYYTNNICFTGRDMKFITDELCFLLVRMRFLIHFCFNKHNKILNIYIPNCDIDPILNATKYHFIIHPSMSISMTTDPRVFSISEKQKKFMLCNTGHTIFFIQTLLRKDKRQNKNPHKYLLEYLKNRIEQNIWINY